MYEAKKQTQLGVPVAFGAKVNKIQDGGIPITPKPSFDAFNECTTLKDSVAKSEDLLVKAKNLAADQIYANNDNRNYLTEEKIITNFTRKGTKTEIDINSETRKKLGILRSTILEGSFGNEKNKQNKSEKQVDRTHLAVFGNNNQ